MRQALTDSITYIIPVSQREAKYGWPARKLPVSESWYIARRSTNLALNAYGLLLLPMFMGAPGPFPSYDRDTRGKEPEMNETSTLQWEIDQLVKTKLFPDEQAVLRSALRALFESQPRLRRQILVRAYTSGEISLGKTAEMLGVSHEEMKDILREGRAEIHPGPRTMDELLQDAANA